MPKIRLPGGYAPEEGKGPGDEVKALVTIRLGGEGQDSEILDIDGAKFEGYEKGEKEKDKVLDEAEKEVPSDNDTSSEAFGKRLDSVMGGDDVIVG